MKLSISNIGWITENDAIAYNLMKKYGYSGLEIAPTRIFPEAPYDKNKEGSFWSKKLKKDYDFSVSSMQSIWFGRQERIFGSDKERQILIDYTKKAIDFAVAIDCKNLVFGCPRNRNLIEGSDTNLAINFFKELGDYAFEHGTTIGMEANPPIYHTNYINDTISALNLIKSVNSRGFLLNLDVGTMIQNEEQVSELEGMVKLIHHVHISEPGLKPIEKRNLHVELKKILESEGYQGFISIEMSRIEEFSCLEEKMKYVREVFI